MERIYVSTLAALFLCLLVATKPTEKAKPTMLADKVAMPFSDGIILTRVRRETRSFY